MNFSTIADEYPIRLSTGETIQVAEIDAERSPALAHVQIRAAVDGLLQHCCHVSREIVEEAKGGYDARFKPLLRAQPAGCMIKSDPHECRLMHDCAMAIRHVCTLRNQNVQTPLPICWEYAPPVILQDMELRNAAIELGSVIGHAWRRGLYVIIVDN
jgi:hypothetical protein